MKFLQKAALSVSTLFATFTASAAVDVSGVGTAITAAQTSAEGVGGLVIAAVAALVVIGLIIGIVRKL